MPSRAELEALIWQAIEAGNWSRAEILSRLIMSRAVSDVAEQIEGVRTMLEGVGENLEKVDWDQLAQLVNRDVAQELQEPGR